MWQCNMRVHWTPTFVALHQLYFVGANFIVLGIFQKLVGTHGIELARTEASLVFATPAADQTSSPVDREPSKRLFVIKAPHLLHFLHLPCILLTKVKCTSLVFLFSKSYWILNLYFYSFSSIRFL